MEDKLPEGWILDSKRKRDGSVSEFYLNVNTGQKFFTKEDLLRYVNYQKNAMTSMPLTLKELRIRAATKTTGNFSEDQPSVDKVESSADPMAEDAVEPAASQAHGEQLSGFEVQVPKWEAEGSEKKKPKRKRGNRHK